MLHKAARCSNVEMLTILLQAGAEVESRDRVCINASLHVIFLYIYVRLCLYVLFVHVNLHLLICMYVCMYVCICICICICICVWQIQQYELSIFM